MKIKLIAILLVFSMSVNAQDKVADLHYIMKRDFSTIYYTVENSDTVYTVQFKTLYSHGPVLLKFQHLNEMKEAMLYMYKLNKKNEISSLRNLSKNRVMYSGNGYIVISSREGEIDYYVSKRYIRKTMERLNIDYRLYDPKGSYEDGMYN